MKIASKKGIVALGACLSILCCLPLSASAKSLAVYEANANWEIVSVREDDTAPRMDLPEDGVSAITYFSAGDNVCVGEYDFSNGAPTKLRMNYAVGSAQQDLGQYIYMFIVLGDDISVEGRWYSNPIPIQSTGDWDSYEDQVWELKPGEGLEWPKGKQKVWLHNSCVGGINVHELEFSNDETDSTPVTDENKGAEPTKKNPSTGEASPVLGVFALAPLSGTAVYAGLRRRSK